MRNDTLTLKGSTKSFAPIQPAKNPRGVIIMRGKVAGGRVYTSDDAANIRAERDMGGSITKSQPRVAEQLTARSMPGAMDGFDTPHYVMTGGSSTAHHGHRRKKR